MANQWQQIDKMIKEAEQDYLQSVPKPSAAEQQRLKAQHSDPFMYRQDLNIEGYDAAYRYIKKHLESKGVVWDDALKDRVITYFAKQHPIKSRSEYVTAGIKDGITYFSINSEVYKKQQELYDERKGHSDSYTKEQVASTGAKFLLDPATYLPTGGCKMIAGFVGYEAIKYFISGSDSTSKDLTASNPIVAPEWMYQQRGIQSFSDSDAVKLKSSYNWAIKNAKNYEKLRDRLYAENKDVYKRRDGTTGSVKELDLRVKEYRFFASQCKQALGMSDIKSELPIAVSKLSTCSDQELQACAAFVQRKIDWCAKKLEEKAKKKEYAWKDSNGKYHTIHEYDILIKEYHNYGQALNKEYNARREHEPEEKESAARPQVYSSTPNVSYSSAQVQDITEQANITSKTGQQWGGLLDTLGLSDFGDVTHNLGYVFSILPDILCAMFTGQLDKLKLKDNLLPIASILMGMFVSNPILKMMMIGLGGANLLNKGVHEVMEKEEEQQLQSNGKVLKYDTLIPEPLNKRITSPDVNGDLVVMQIDGKPYCVTIDAQTASLYKQGMIPLNNLCNKIVSIYDSQGESVNGAQQQTQNVVVSDTQERSRGLR